MKKLLTSTAILALMAGVSPAMAQSQCDIGQATNYTEEDDAVTLGARSDLRRLRDSAMILKSYGQEQACQNVVEAIQEIRSNRGQMNQAQQQDQTQQQTTGQTVQQNQATQPDQTAQQGRIDYLQAMQNAKPVSEIGGRLTVEKVLDADVRGATGEVLGEIDDIVLDQKGQPSHAVVAFGGFLGIGEDRAAIPFDKLRVVTNVNDMDNMVFYIPMTEEQLASAPRVQENDTSWLSNDDWVAQNEEYYENNAAEG